MILDGLLKGRPPDFAITDAKCLKKEVNRLERVAFRTPSKSVGGLPILLPN